MPKATMFIAKLYNKGYKRKQIAIALYDLKIDGIKTLKEAEKAIEAFLKK